MQQSRIAIIFMAMMCLGLGLMISCNGNGEKTVVVKNGDGDNNSSSGDDDSGGGSGNNDDDASADGNVWQDDTTGLIWANEVLFRGCYPEAVEYCDNLSFGGYDDWRVPNIDELRSLIEGCPATETGGSCGVTDSCRDIFDCEDDSCNGCLGVEPPNGCFWKAGLDGPCDFYFSSTKIEGLSSSEDHYYSVLFLFADLWRSYGEYFNDPSTGIYVRCVR